MAEPASIRGPQGWAALGGSIAAFAAAAAIDAASLPDTSASAAIYASQMLLCAVAGGVLIWLAWRVALARWWLLLTAPLWALYVIRGVNAAIFAWSSFP